MAVAVTQAPNAGGPLANSFPSDVESGGTIRAVTAVKATRVITNEGAPTSLATAGAATYTIAQLLTGIIVRDCAGASRTDVLPTAELAVAGLAGVKVGDVIRCYIINGSDAAETITIDAGTGGGYETNQTATSRVIGQNTSKMLHLRFTVVTAGSEAYVAYL